MQDLTKLSDEDLVKHHADLWFCMGHDVIDADDTAPARDELLRRLKSAHIRSDSEVGCGEGAD